MLLQYKNYTLEQLGSQLRFSDGVSTLVSPPEGLWSVAAAWENNAPAQWFHSGSFKAEKFGSDLRLSSKLPLPGGEISCVDECYFEFDTLKIRRRWSYSGTAMPQVTLSCRWQQPEKFGRIVMPGILYFGNPSGRSTPGVPYLDCTCNAKLFCEEHRFPMPFAASETQSDAALAALHTFPSPVPGANRRDLFWTLGVEYLPEATELALYSGFTSINGIDGGIKTGQKRLTVMSDQTMTLTDGMMVEKTFALQLAHGRAAGSAFTDAVEQSIKFHPVKVINTDPARIVRKKYEYALMRYYEQEKIAGNLFNDHPSCEDAIVFGWCGRSETLGLAAPLIGRQCGDRQSAERAKKCLDFMASSPVSEKGFCVEYYIKSGTWQEYNFVSQGEALETFAMALLEQRKRTGKADAHHLEFLAKVCHAFCDRIENAAWKPVSTNEAFLCAPLAMAYELLQEKRFRNGALRIADYYIERHRAMVEPYWGGTLDASCEDKEAAVAAMTAYFAVWEMTGKAEYLAAAEHATALYLTYLQVWDIPLPPGRLADNGFRTAGWSAVSVQNMHLDVYGVWVAPLLWKIGKALRRQSWMDLALPTYINCAQLLDIRGSQGEQFEQTNFSQQPMVTELDQLRGGYSEKWVVFWITAAFLNSAAQFEMLGLSLFDNAEQLS